MIVQFHVWTRARLRVDRISNWPLKPRDGRSRLRRKRTDSTNASTRNGTQTNAAFCSQSGFLATFRIATSVIAPAALRLTSSATPCVGFTSTIRPAASFVTDSRAALTLSVSRRTTFFSTPSSFTTSIAAARSGLLTTTSFTTPASLVTVSAPLIGSALVKTCGPPAIAPSAAKPMIQGATNCTMETPKLPRPAWMPIAVPCSRFGKKIDVDGMNDEKSPPPIPHRKPITMNVHQDVFRSWIA